jgi:hypothetical protein
MKGIGTPASPDINGNWQSCYSLGGKSNPQSLVIVGDKNPRDPNASTKKLDKYPDPNNLNSKNHGLDSNGRNAGQNIGAIDGSAVWNTTAAVRSGGSSTLDDYIYTGYSSNTTTGISGGRNDPNGIPDVNSGIVDPNHIVFLLP